MDSEMGLYIRKLVRMSRICELYRQSATAALLVQCTILLERFLTIIADV